MLTCLQNGVPCFDSGGGGGGGGGGGWGSGSLWVTTHVLCSQHLNLM